MLLCQYTVKMIDSARIIYMRNYD